MLKELSIAVVLTLVLSFGVGVLFVRTIMEMIELMINGSTDSGEEDIKGESVRT